ncbi:MAG: PIN domain-containing protein [Candidatus Binataceae bacterium]
MARRVGPSGITSRRTHRPRGRCTRGVRLYVESNFALELALRQEHHQACEEILSFCETRDETVVFPAFCVLEAHYALVEKRRRRTHFKKDFDAERTQLLRSSRYKDRARHLDAVSRFLIASVEEEDRDFRAVIERLLRAARLMPLDLEVLRFAATLRDSFDLELPDSIVLASVLGDLEASSGASCFVTRDKKDFVNPGIQALLAAKDCKALFDFEHGRDYLLGRNA